MVSPGSETTDRASRRKFLAAVAGAGVVGLSGCLDGEPGAGTPTTAETTDATTASGDDDGDGDDESGDDTPTKRPPQTTTLTGDGSSTMYPVTSRAASVWNSNPPARDRKAWGPRQYGIRTDERVADYWAGLYEFSNDRSTQPPILVNVGLSNSETGLAKTMEGAVDVGDASAPVEDVLPDPSDAELDGFEDHVVGVDGQPVVVSREVYDAGVTRLTGDQLRGIFTGEIEQWSTIPSYRGPDREIRAVGRSEGSGTDASFRANLFGDADASLPGLDVQKDQNKQVATLVEKSNNAVAYLALAFVDEKAVPPVALELGDTIYEYGENLGAESYPLSRDLHVYTYGGTSETEAAFIRMLLSEYGQERFVEASGYFALSPERRRRQLAKLPATTGGRPPGTETASNETTST